MKEHLRHQLNPDVQRALREAQRFCGKEPILRRVDDLPHNTRAILRRPVVPHRPYQIEYRKGEERVLDHLITHELGHIVRLHRVPEPERLGAYVSTDSRRFAAEQIQDEFIPLLDGGMSPDTIVAMVGDFHEALIEQVANGPADLRIEQWISDRFPGLRKVQEVSLVEEVHRGDDAFHPLVRQMVPASIYWPTLAMNAAQAWHVAQLFGKPELLRPFNTQQLTGLGEDLARMVLDVSDQGHRSDMVATNRWAEELRLTGWFEWQPFEQSR